MFVRAAFRRARGRAESVRDSWKRGLMVLVAPGAISVCRCLGWKSSSLGGGGCVW
jgi:hypothetical protein